jgi:putative transposase
MKGDIFHIINRGVDKRVIFNDNDDYTRFCNNLEDFNDKRNVEESYYNRTKLKEIFVKNDKNKLVDILCVVLMPNHFHILAREKIDGGASLFSKKITSGYTQAFNLKNKRSGVLFQGRTKKILVVKDEHFYILPFYIFSNPIKLLESNWKKEGLKSLSNVKKFIKNYKWSSLNNEKLKQIIDRNKFLDIFNVENEKKFIEDFDNWLESFG